MRDHDISQRRACRLVGVDPKTVRRDQPPDNPEVREEMKAIASKRRRFGYRRIGMLLERKGMTMNNDLFPKFPPALREVLGVKSLTSSGHLVHDPSLQEFRRWQVIPNAECGLRQL